VRERRGICKGRRGAGSRSISIYLIMERGSRVH